MNRDKSFHYEDISPSKESPSKSYPRKYDAQQTRNKGTSLHESKENISPTLAGGSRDVLLMKCKQAIEELHIELESERKIRQEIEDSLAETENELHEKDSQLREMRYNQEKLQDEARTYKNQNESLIRKLEDMEDQLRILDNTDVANDELQRELQSMRKANNDLKEKVKGLELDLEDRDASIKHWNDTLTSVQDKLRDLENENKVLKRDHQDMLEKNQKLNLFLEDSENSTSLLQHKQRDLEHTIQQLQEENRAIESLRENNAKLRDQLQQYQKDIKILKEENHVDLLKFEEQFLKEKQELEDSLKEKHRRVMNDLQEKLNNEINRERESNDDAINELHRIKSERDILKQEVGRLENRIEVVDLENKKMIDNIMKNYESLNNNKEAEVDRLKNVIEDQEQLMNSYKKIMEKEKAEHSEQNEQANEEINELKVNNEYLTTKLRACQEELTYLRKEVHSSFSVEEERQEQLAKKLRELEAEIIERNAKVNLLNEQIDSLRTVERRQSEEIEALNKAKRRVEEELLQTKEQLMRAQREIEELRQTQKEWSRIQNRMTNMTEELEHEQERRIDAETKVKVREDRILELEAKVQSYRKLVTNPNDTIQTNETRTNIEVSELPTRASKKNFDSIVNSSYRQEPSLKFYQSTRTTKPDEEHHYPPLQIESHDVRRRLKSKEHTNTSYNLPHRIEGATPQRLNTTTAESKRKAPDSPEFVHHKFINKFKTVIEKLENKLESITADIGSPSS